MLRLTGQVFADSDLFAVAERIGYRCFDVIEGIATPKTVAARHRKVLGLVERRPALVVLAGTVLILVAVVVGISAFSPNV